MTQHYRNQLHSNQTNQYLNVRNMTKAVENAFVSVAFCVAVVFFFAHEYHIHISIKHETQFRCVTLFSVAIKRVVVAAAAVVDASGEEFSTNYA